MRIKLKSGNFYRDITVGKFREEIVYYGGKSDKPWLERPYMFFMRKGSRMTECDCARVKILLDGRLILVNYEYKNIASQELKNHLEDIFNANDIRN